MTSPTALAAAERLRALLHDAFARTREARELAACLEDSHVEACVLRAQADLLDASIAARAAAREHLTAAGR